MVETRGGGYNEKGRKAQEQSGFRWHLPTVICKILGVETVLHNIGAFRRPSLFPRTGDVALVALFWPP